MSIELLDIIDTFYKIFSHVSFHHNYEEMNVFTEYSSEVQRYFLHNLFQHRYQFSILSLNWDARSIVDALDLHWSSILNPTVFTPISIVTLEVLSLTKSLSVLSADHVNILILPKVSNDVTENYKWLLSLHSPSEIFSFNYFNGDYFDLNNNQITFIDLSKLPQLHGFTAKLYFLDNNSWTPYNHTDSFDISLPIEMKSGNALYQAWLQNKISPNVEDSFLSLSNTTYFGDNTGSDSE